MGMGLIGSVSLIIGPIHIADKKLDIHTLVYTSVCILLGFQFIGFFLFTKLYAATHGLLPSEAHFIEQFNRYFRLERGLMAGAILLLAGLTITLKSFLDWSHTGFGNLDPVKVLRWVIPSAVLILLGVQMILSCFYLSILTLKNTSSNQPSS